MAGKLTLDVQYARPTPPRRHPQQDATSNFDLSMQLASSTPENLMKEFLLPHFKRLCREPDGPVRAHVAAVFHEFAQSLKHDAPLLIDSFIDLSYSGDVEVISHLASHLEETLECIYGTRKEANGGEVNQKPNHFNPQFHPAHGRLIRTLVSCNRIVRNGSQWRCHEQLLKSYGCLNRFLSLEDLRQTFVPLMKEEILTARALPCRLAALRSMISWIQSMQSLKDIQSITDFCKTSLARNRSCHKRVLYLDACEMALELISKQFFKDRFFFLAMQLANDSVLNVRMKLCKLLPLFKTALTMPGDVDYIMALDNAVKSFIKSDPKGSMAEIVDKTVKELATLSTMEPAIAAPKILPLHPSMPSPREITSVKPITKNSAAPLPARTFPAVFRAFTQPKAKADASKTPPDLGNGEAASAPVQNGFLANGFSKPSSKLSELLQMKTMPNKKVAVIYPRQVANSSPSPRPMSQPAFNLYENGFEPVDKVSYDDSIYAPTTASQFADSAPPPPKPTIDSKLRRFWSKPPFSHALGEMQDSLSERIVPIKLVATKSAPEYDWVNARPPTPAVFRRMSASTASLPRSTAATTATRVRHIPVVRTGVVMQSVEKFENGAVNGMS